MKRFFILLLCFTCFCGYAFAKLPSHWTKPSTVTQAEWDQLSPYFLPTNHPIAAKLHHIFTHTSRPRITKSKKTIKKAGFKFKGTGYWEKIMVFSHPKLEGYLLKVYPDDREVLHTAECCLKRVQGAILAQQLIKKHQLDHIFKVPKKWIYPIPEDRTYRVSRSKPHFCLVVEDMKILKKKKNFKQWRSENLSPRILKGLFTLVKEGGFWDSLGPKNVPFCEDGKLALVDTEYFHAHGVRYIRLEKHLCPEKATEWRTICKNGLGLGDKKRRIY